MCTTGWGCTRGDGDGEEAAEQQCQRLRKRRFGERVEKGDGKLKAKDLSLRRNGSSFKERFFIQPMFSISTKQSEK